MKRSLEKRKGKRGCAFNFLRKLLSFVPDSALSHLRATVDTKRDERKRKKGIDTTGKQRRRKRLTRENEKERKERLREYVSGGDEVQRWRRRGGWYAIRKIQ